MTCDWVEAQTFPCYSTGRSWNGWGLPVFGKATMLEFVAGNNKAVGLAGDGLLEFDEATQKIKFHDSNEDADVFWDPFTITADGQDIVVWAIGDGWCWNSVVFPEGA